MYQLKLTLEAALSHWELRYEKAGLVRINEGHFTIPYTDGNELIKKYVDRATRLHPGTREINFELEREDIDHAEALLSEISSFTPLSETASTTGSERAAAAGAGTGGGLAASLGLFSGTSGYTTPPAEAKVGADDWAFSTSPDSVPSLSNSCLYALGLSGASEPTRGGSRFHGEGGR